MMCFRNCNIKVNLTLEKNKIKNVEIFNIIGPELLIILSGTKIQKTADVAGFFMY